jgi:hypothetical protein
VYHGPVIYVTNVYIKVDSTTAIELYSIKTLTHGKYILGSRDVLGNHHTSFHIHPTQIFGRKLSYKIQAPNNEHADDA